MVVHTSAKFAQNKNIFIVLMIQLAFVHPAQLLAHLPASVSLCLCRLSALSLETLLLAPHHKMFHVHVFVVRRLL